MQGWTATQGMELQKKEEKDEEYTWKLFRKNKDKSFPLILEPFRLLCQRKAICR